MSFQEGFEKKAITPKRYRDAIKQVIKDKPSLEGKTYHRIRDYGSKGFHRQRKLGWSKVTNKNSWIRFRGEEWVRGLDQQRDIERSKSFWRFKYKDIL